MVNILAAITAYERQNCVSLLIRNPRYSECFVSEVRLSSHRTSTIIQLSRREIYLDLGR